MGARVAAASIPFLTNAVPLPATFVGLTM